MRSNPIFLTLSILMIITATNCSRKEKESMTNQLEPELSKSGIDTSDRQPNGGMLRYTLEGMLFEDEFFVALFTPRGDIFRYDNLQLFNYNIGSDKYPQFIISIDNVESDLAKWRDKTFPLDFCSLTAVKNTVPLNSEGNVTITKITATTVEGRFSGNLINTLKEKKFPIQGEFRAILQVNL
jgi:hypothetical protein